MKVSMSCTSDYDSKYDWDCNCQGGEDGLVIQRKGGAYNTAFFEAFPRNPSCFLRGEGSSIEEAEEDCWQKYQVVRTCKHEIMERRGRTDGYAYCTKCSYSSTVFEPLTKCCKCGKPTAYTQDYKGKYYCEKHGVTKPKNPNPGKYDWDIRHRVPRKRKKLLKKCAKLKFAEKGRYGKVKYTYKLAIKFTCDDYRLDLLFKKHEKDLIRKYGRS